MRSGQAGVLLPVVPDGAEPSSSEHRPRAKAPSVTRCRRHGCREAWPGRRRRGRRRRHEALPPPGSGLQAVSWVSVPQGRRDLPKVTHPQGQEGTTWPGPRPAPEHSATDSTATPAPRHAPATAAGLRGDAARRPLSNRFSPTRSRSPSCLSVSPDEDANAGGVAVRHSWGCARICHPRLGRSAGTSSREQGQKRRVLGDWHALARPGAAPGGRVRRGVTLETRSPSRLVPSLVPAAPGERPVHGTTYRHVT